MVSRIEPEKESSSLGINYSNLGVIAIKAIQEQQLVIEPQNKRITELEATLKDLKQVMTEYIKSHENKDE